MLKKKRRILLLLLVYKETFIKKMTTSLINIVPMYYSLNHRMDIFVKGGRD
jgi:hypothetical protein